MDRTPPIHYSPSRTAHRSSQEGEPDLAPVTPRAPGLSALPTAPLDSKSASVGSSSAPRAKLDENKRQAIRCIQKLLRAGHPPRIDLYGKASGIITACSDIDGRPHITVVVDHVHEHLDEEHEKHFTAQGSDAHTATYLVNLTGCKLKTQTGNSKAPLRMD